MVNDTTYATVEQASVTGGEVWRCTRVHHLTGAENRGKRNIFVQVYQIGQMIRDGKTRIIWGWEGQRPDEYAKPAICDKTEPDYCTDIQIDKGQRIWLRVDDGNGTPSDIVRGIHSGMDSDGEGNSLFHNSTAVTFEKQGYIAPPVITEPPTIPTSGTWQEAVAELDHRLKIVENFINAKG